MAFTTLQARLQMPLLQLMRVTLDVQTSLALFRRIFEYLDLEPAITERPGAVALDARRDAAARSSSATSGSATPSHASCRGTVNRDRFGDTGVRIERRTRTDPRRGRTPRLGAARTSRCVVEPGQLAAIVGPSGSGKTTMTYLVPRFYDVTEGAVLIDGHDVRDLTLGSLADAVGMVTQEPYLFHGTIRDNIAYAKPGRHREPRSSRPPATPTSTTGS